MCTYNLSVNDVLIEKARSAFSDDNALKEWLQKQLDAALNVLVNKNSSVHNPAPRLKHNHDDLMGILSDAPNKDYKRMYLNEKYGL